MKTKYLHRLDGVMGVLDGVDLNVLGDVRQQQLVHDFDFIILGLYRDEWMGHVSVHPKKSKPGGDQKLDNPNLGMPSIILLDRGITCSRISFHDRLDGSSLHLGFFYSAIVCIRTVTSLSLVHPLLLSLSTPLDQPSLMIDHLVGRPNPSWKRTQVPLAHICIKGIFTDNPQVYLVILFWLWRIVRGESGPPRLLFLPRINRRLRTRYPAFDEQC